MRHFHPMFFSSLYRRIPSYEGIHPPLPSFVLIVLMNQIEEDSLYHSLEEEAIDVDCLLVEPRSDQGVWCFEENLEKCIKAENAPYNLGIRNSNLNGKSVVPSNLSAREVGMEHLLATNDVSPCEDYLLDIGYVDHGACMDYVSNDGLHAGNSSSQSQFPMKGSFGIHHSSTENISECQNYFLGNSIFANSSKSKTVDRFDDFSKSFIDQENNEDILPPHFAQNGMELTPFCQDPHTSSPQDHVVGAVIQKRSRKPTKRYIDESSMLNLKNCKKRREASSMPKVKISGVQRVKSQIEVESKEKITSSEISFGKAIQVPFISQGRIECQKKSSPPMIENRIESYSNGSEDEDDLETKRSMTSSNQRKLHRLWTISEVKKLIDGVAHFGVGKWTHIKKLLFSSSVHRTPVDLKDKWRNLLKASHALKGSRIEEEQKRSQPWRPLPKSILSRVRELACVYPYPREDNSKVSKSKFPLAHHVSSPARIKGGNKVPV